MCEEDMQFFTVLLIYSSSYLHNAWIQFYSEVRVLRNHCPDVEESLEPRIALLVTDDYDEVEVVFEESEEHTESIHKIKD